jgi:protein-disulfide isomerase
VSSGTSRRRPRIAGVIAFVLAVGALLALVASLSLDKGSDKPVEITGAGEVQSLMGGIEEKDATLGSPNAPVTIDFFNDLQCSFCADYQKTVVPKLVADLVRPGKAALVYRHFPLGDKATELADFGALAAAKQDYEWQFVQLFFINQGAVPPVKGVNEDFLSRIAAAILEMDQGQWLSDYKKIAAGDDSAAKAVLDNDTKLEIDLRLPAEPAVVITGPRGVRKLIQRPSLAEIESAVSDVS